MKKIRRLLKWTGLSLVLLLLIALFFSIWTVHVKGNNSINALEQVEINGSSHEIMIRDHDKNNPVIIFVHGGPGNSEIPYAKKYQDLLEKNFTVVNYAQRASGKSYHFFEDYSNFSSDLLVEALLAITDYISERFGKEKVILIGHSYGTYIGMQAAYKAPQKYEAYVGMGEMSDTVQSELDSLNYVMNKTKRAGNTDDIPALQGVREKIIKDETFTPRNFVIKYGGGARGIDNPDGDNLGMLLSSEYNLLDVIGYNYGTAYSQETLLKEVLKEPLPTMVTELKLLCYFVMGKYDYMTSSHAAKENLKLITKSLLLFITPHTIRNLKRRKSFISGCAIHF